MTGETLQRGGGGGGGEREYRRQFHTNTSRRARLAVHM